MKTKLLLASLCLILLAVSSCTQLSARPEMDRLIRLQANNIAELDDRCQNGDMEAGKGCSALANVSFQQLVAALDGKMVDPNE